MKRALPLALLLAAGGAAHAQGVGLPSSRWGIGFGNSPDFIGLRFNFRDDNVRRVIGVNLTLWSPEDHDQDAVVTGLTFGPLPGGGTLRGLQVGILGVVALKSTYGINLGPIGAGAGEDMIGLNVGGIGMGTGRDLIGVNVGGVGMGAGGTLAGLNLAGIGFGAGEDVIGLNVAGIGIGAGRRVMGITVAGIGVGAGEEVAGLTIAGIGVGAPKVAGLTIAVGAVGGNRIEGVAIAGAAVHVIKKGEMVGLAVSPFNYILGRQTGIAIGIVNYAWSVRGVQLGLVNIVRDNPTPLRVLPVFNTSF